jgi:NADPH:quinone reductase-like Zn-dependent oxidoreductase
VEANGEELSEIVRLVAAGQVEPHVDSVYPLDRAAEALARVEQHQSRGKVVLMMETPPAASKAG